MTEKLYDKDSHLREFTATVLSCEKADKNYKTVLDKTAFFPEAGGQDCDRGTLNEVQVFDVRIEDEVIYHFTEKPFAVGERVTGKIDWERRFDFMQQHTAEHILSGIAHRLYGCTNVGFHLSEDIVTFDFDKPLNRSELDKLEQLGNEAVYKNSAVKAYYPDDETLKKLDYRSKKELEGEVRIVEIGDTDICACCAPHVDFTGEVGAIKLISVEALRGGIRMELKAGKRAYLDSKNDFENTLKISNSLCAKREETAAAVEKLLSQLSDLRAEITAYKRQIITNIIESFTDKKQFTADIFENFEIKELQALADGLYKEYGGIRAVLSKKEDGLAFVICGNENDLTPLFAEFKEKFKVKGGGRGSMVQGTVFAEFSEILKFTEEKQ